MSEQAPASLNLEDGTEAVGAALVTPAPTPEPTPDPPAPAPVAPATEDTDPEGTIEATGGVKFVPLDAVKAERARRKEAEKSAAEKEALAQQLADKAAKYDQTEAYLRQAQPIIETLRQRPELIKLAQQPPPPEPTAGPLTDQEAVEYAKDLDLYKADGTPDIARAQRLAARQQSLAERQARQAVAPIYQQSAIQQSAMMRQAILQMKDDAGNAKYDPAVLDQVWKLVPPEESAKPEIASALATFADGLMYQRSRGRVVAPPPPVVTESVGGGKPAAQLDGTAEAMLRASGLTRKDYTAMRSEYKDGHTNSLE